MAKDSYKLGAGGRLIHIDDWNKALERVGKLTPVIKTKAKKNVATKKGADE
jgi:hypothetical protein